MLKTQDQVFQKALVLNLNDDSYFLLKASKIFEKGSHESIWNFVNQLKILNQWYQDRSPYSSKQDWCCDLGLWTYLFASLCMKLAFQYFCFSLASRNCFKFQDFWSSSIVARWESALVVIQHLKSNLLRAPQETQEETELKKIILEVYQLPLCFKCTFIQFCICLKRKSLLEIYCELKMEIFTFEILKSQFSFIFK